MIKDFEYFGPKTLNEALVLLDKYRDDYKIIAGGQSLIILLRQGLLATRECHRYLRHQRIGLHQI
jgi:CO/xanthine dehydrogenase FAD-binding subunit